MVPAARQGGSTCQDHPPAGRVRNFYRGFCLGLLVQLAAAPACTHAADGTPAAPAAAADGAMESIVVTAGADSAAQRDAKLAQAAEAALRDDPYIFADHVTVTVKDGVVSLHGMMFELWDLQLARRRLRRLPGIKAVDDDIELNAGMTDGGAGW